MPVRFVDEDTVNAALDPARLVAALRTAFCGDAIAPLRHHHSISGAQTGTDVTLLLMPAWSAGNPPGYIGIKSLPCTRTIRPAAFPPCRVCACCSMVPPGHRWP
jgi:ornithine cyclodeaminase/alanine dehydrogenase-like protein (mu-crystallin family)